MYKSLVIAQKSPPWACDKECAEACGERSSAPGPCSALSIYVVALSKMTAVLTEEPRLEEKVNDASVEVDEEAEELQENGVDSSSKKKKKKKKKKKGGLHLFSQ